MGFITNVKSQIYHYELKEVVLRIPGEAKKVQGMYGRNVEIILDLDKMTLSIPKVNNTNYKIKNLQVFGEDSDNIIYQGISSESNEYNWKYSHFIHKKDNWNIFKMESINEPGTSISYIGVLSDTLVKKSITRSSGSGFLISEDGRIATNSHVIKDANKIEVTISNETGTTTYKAEVFFNNPENDIAILKIKDNKFKTLKNIPYGIATKAEVGEKVFTIGFPLNNIMGENYKSN
jgi:S1-C subfamily serine protease